MVDLRFVLLGDVACLLGGAYIGYVYGKHVMSKALAVKADVEKAIKDVKSKF